MNEEYIKVLEDKKVAIEQAIRDTEANFMRLQGALAVLNELIELSKEENK